MKVSVIIPTYNHGRYITDAVDSALAQTHPASEVIVVDDGSTDQTCDLVAPYRHRVRYIYQPNRGLSAARNTGINAARGEWLAFLDADDFWLPEKLERQANVIATSPGVVLVYCSAWRIESDGSRVFAKCIDTRKLWPTLRYRNCVSGGSAAVVRKDVVAEAGCFDESLRACEDWDLWVRLAAKYRNRFASVDEPLLVIRASPASMSADHIRMTQNTEKILERTLLLGLKGFRRSLWRRRIRSADLYRAAVSARFWSNKTERELLCESLLQWPSPLFLKARWRALQLNLLKHASSAVQRTLPNGNKTQNLS
jgi:glycosyltransferase involved in cell wall biosynthesis